MKYLETNAIRKHASRIGDSNFIVDKYTSILSLIELASGIKDNVSFKLRQSIIKKVIYSRIRIELTLPELLIFNAFGFDFVSSISKCNELQLDVRWNRCYHLWNWKCDNN